MKKTASNDNYIYGNIIRELRIQKGLTQNQVAADLQVTPGYISNVEKGRTAMSLRILVYYAKLMNMSLDTLVGKLDPDYHEIAVDRDIMKEVSKMSLENKNKLLETLKIWND